MIEINDLSFSYSGKKPYILDGISFEIKTGEYVSIVGENGCGKSTLMRLILGLEKPSSGSINCSSKRIGYVPQKVDGVNSGFPITVYEMLYSYQKLLKIKDKSIIMDQLNVVGMTAYAKVLMDHLSGGQSQKIRIARALMGNPDLLILDEPSTGVDISSQKEIYALLKELNKEKNMTILSVEHNMDAAVKNSTLIYHLQSGHGHFCNVEKFAEEYLGRREAF